MLGGLISRVVKNVNITIIGGFFAGSIGSLLLLINNTNNILYAGLSLLLISTGLIRSNIAAYVSDEEEDKERNFTKVYIFQNIGTILGTLIISVIGEVYGWNISYISMTIFYLLGAIFFILVKKSENFNSLKSVYIAPIIAVSSIIIICLFKYDLISIIMVITFIISLFTLIMLLQKTNKKMVGPVISVFITQSIFALLYEQSITTLTMFIERNVSKTIFNDIEIPTTLFQVCDPIFASTIGCLLINLWKDSSDTRNSFKKTKFALLILCGGYLLLTISRFFYATDGYVSALWPLGAAACFALGELFVVPIGLSILASALNKEVSSMAMACWFVLIGSANYFSAYLSDLTSHAAEASNKVESLIIYTDAFFIFSLIAVSCFIIMAFSERVILKRLSS